MTIPDFKKIARLLKTAYAELEQQALKEGLDLLSPQYTEYQDKLRLGVLTKAGFTIEEYRQIKSEVENVSKASILQSKQEVDKILADLKDRHIPTEEEISGIAERVAQEVAKQYIVPPQITNQIVKETTVVQPVKETVIQKEEYDDRPIMAEIGSLNDRLESIPKAEPFNPDPLKTEILTYFADNFGKNFEQNIKMLNMPDFRALAMGLRQDIDTKIQGVNTLKLTVSNTAPSNPQLNDLWYNTT